MINPATIDQFLARKLESFDWIKLEDEAAIAAVLNALNPAPKLGSLWLHQQVCFLLVEARKRFMLHLAMGSGKTLVVLSILRYRKQCGEQPKAIVFVPYITAVETWVEETAKHTPELKCVLLTGTTKENLHALLHEQGDLYVLCYQSAVAMLAQPAKKGRGKKAWAINPQWVREVFKGFDTLIMDEAHRTKAVASLTYKMCRAISSTASYAVGLTGTPFGRDLQDLWPQFYLVDFGATLGPSLGFYREVFFRKKQNYWGGFEYEFKKPMFPDLQRMIKNCSIRYSVDELHDMPPKEYIIKRVKPHEGIKAYADQSLEKIRQALSVTHEGERYRAIESQYLKLRQLASGFMTFTGMEDEKGKKDKIQIKFDENPKLDLLEELVESMAFDAKMVVFHHFVYTNYLISERLKALKVKHARIWGGQRDPIGELRKFKQEAECRVLVINSKSGSSSLNLQNAQYVVFFEQPDAAIDRQQAEARVWRAGQDKRVMIFDFLMNETVDAHQHKWNKDGENLLTALLDGRVKL